MNINITINSADKKKADSLLNKAVRKVKAYIEIASPDKEEAKAWVINNDEGHCKVQVDMDEGAHSE